ncbi:MAG: ABC transporter ATP-binding protein, partial [Gaiellaceae bacterium]
GRRQLFTLALSPVAEARAIVLDDPLSPFDKQTERRLVENLRPALAGLTVLIATQRLSTVEVADRAVVIVEGRIAEDGTPAHLLAAGGPFAALFGDELVAA